VEVHNQSKSYQCYPYNLMMTHTKYRQIHFHVFEPSQENERVSTSLGNNHSLSYHLVLVYLGVLYDGTMVAKAESRPS
jgi:hypothetical protein